MHIAILYSGLLRGESNVFTNPLMMPCLHSFCKKCIELQLEEQGSSAGSIKCPSCNTVSSLPSGGVARLSVNHWLAHQAEVLTYQQKIEDGSGIPCDRCVKKANGAATAFCCNCCLFLCSSCQEDHQWWRETVSHELVSVGEKKTGMDSKTKIPRKPAMCIEHPNEELKFYCDTCQCLVCRDCIVIEHKEHSQSYSIIAAEKEKEALGMTLQEAEDAITTLETAVTSRENIKKQVEDQKSRMNEMITQEFNKIYTALQEKEKELHRKCEAVANQKLTVLTMENEEIEDLKKSLVFSTQIASGAQNSTPVELLSTKKSIQEHLQSRLTTFAQLELEPGVNDKISVVLDKTALDEATLKLGSVSEICDPAQCTVEEGLIIPLATVGKKREVKVALKDDNGGLVCEKVPMTARLVAKYDESVLPVDIRFEGDGHAFLLFQPVIVGEHELTIKVMNRQLAGSPYKIWSRQSPTHKDISSKQRFDVGSHSMGVTVHHNGDVFASNSQDNYIQVFSSDGSQKLQIGSPGSGDGQLNTPSGLTIIGEV